MSTLITYKCQNTGGNKYSYPDGLVGQFRGARSEGLPERIHPGIDVELDPIFLQHGDVLGPLRENPGPDVWGNGENALVVLGLPLVPQLALVPHMH